MVLSRSSSDRSVAAAVAAAGDCEAWPYLEQDVLRPSRSRKVCMTCHWFRHHAALTGHVVRPALAAADQVIALANQALVQLAGE